MGCTAPARGWISSAPAASAVNRSIVRLVTFGRSKGAVSILLHSTAAWETIDCLPHASCFSTQSKRRRGDLFFCHGNHGAQPSRLPKAPDELVSRACARAPLARRHRSLPYLGFGGDAAANPRGRRHRALP